MGAAPNNPAVYSNPYTAAAAIALQIGEAIIKFVGVGGGCGQPCIQAAQLEQVFEVAADYVHWWGNLGYISKGEMAAGLNQLLTLGQKNLAGVGTSQAQAGSRNMTKVINQLISKPLQAPDWPTKAWARNAALDAGAQHVNASAGWYQAAYAKGQALAVQVVEQGILPGRPALSSIGASLSGHKTLLIMGGLIVAAKKLFL